MSSWRDSASAQAQQDLDDLLNITLPFAKEQLAKHGEFYPYGAMVALNGETRLLATYSGERPLASKVIDDCYEGLRQKRGEIRAAAVVTNMILHAGGYAIAVAMEHSEGQAMEAILPYSKNGQLVEYGQLSAAPTSKRVWP